MKSKVVTSFLGGFVGILLSGYIYHYTGDTHPLMIPAGTFIGCLIGFSWFHFKSIIGQVSRIFQRVNLRWPDPSPIFQASINAWIWILEKINVSRLLSNLKYAGSILLRLLIMGIKGIRDTFRATINWFKSHPMNGYLVQEIIILTVILGIAIIVSIRIGFLQANDDNLISFPKAIVACCLFLGIASCFFLIFGRSQQDFYADFQLYSRWKTIGVIIKTISRTIIVISLAHLATATILSIGFGVVIYIVFITMLSILLIAITATVKYLIELTRSHKELTTLITTMMITVISYYLWRDYFASQAFIWLVAFITGIASAMAVMLVLSFSGKTISRFYQYLNADFDPLEKAYYKGSWGNLIMTPCHWIIEGAGKMLDKSFATYSTFQLRMR